MKINQKRMLETPKITLEILEHFAKDETPFPANETLETLCKKLPQHDESTIKFHLICAYDNNLLLGGGYKRYTYLAEGADYTFGWIDGLSHKGSEFVQMARTGLRKTALKKIKETGQKVTTDLLFQMLRTLTFQGLH